jgi:phosphatidate cytidylyltransferase
MLARILSALVLVPVVLALVAFAPHWVFLTVVGVLGTLCLHEFGTLSKGMGLEGQPWLTVLAWWFLLIGMRRHWLPDSLLFGAVLVAAFLVSMWRPRGVRERALGFAGDVTGIAYVTLSLYPILPIRFDFAEPTGLHWLIVVLVTTWAGDTAAMFTGKYLGRTRFAPVLSPKKTNEGSIGGLAGGLVGALLVRQLLLRDLPPGTVVLVSLATGAAGQLGDLAESLLKRAAGVKDSSSLIPGHGGILDRIDSLMFAFPVLWAILLLIHSA